MTVTRHEPSKIYSKVVEANGFVFLAGQVGDVPGKPGAVPGGIEAETRQMLENVGRLLRMAGLDYPDVVKCTVYLRDFSDFAAMNAVYREFFPKEPPTRATVGVTALAEDFRVEIERPASLVLGYIDREGKPQELKAEGLLATAIQHEVDHLNGKLIIDFLSKLKRDMVVRKFKKAARGEASL